MNIEYPCMVKTSAPVDLVCFSHLRWNFVYQRPQHLLSRYANHYRVFYVEEPILYNGKDQYQINISVERVWVVTPMLSDKEQPEFTLIDRYAMLLDELFKEMAIENYIFKYYTPMALKFTSHLKPLSIIYDCMDELSAFKFAPAELKLLEQEMFSKADVVFTGGYSLYQAKKNQHKNIYPFPSSIDKDHFNRARNNTKKPADQEKIKGFRLGFFGVIDERFDRNLIEELADKKPEWQFILLGPVVKINPADLPQRNNIHYLGSKSYNELPDYIAGWDIAMIPFAKNESTQFISPTKTPEYLAAGKPVISASIMDVVNPYGEEGLIHIADTADGYIHAVEKILSQSKHEKNAWLNNVDDFLKNNSWDNTWNKMHSHVLEVTEAKLSSKENPAFKSVA